MYTVIADICWSFQSLPREQLVRQSSAVSANNSPCQQLCHYHNKRARTIYKRSVHVRILKFYIPTVYSRTLTERVKGRGWIGSPWVGDVFYLMVNSAAWAVSLLAFILFLSSLFMFLSSVLVPQYPCTYNPMQCSLVPIQCSFVQSSLCYAMFIQLEKQ